MINYEFNVILGISYNLSLALVRLFFSKTVNNVVLIKYIAYLD